MASAEIRTKQDLIPPEGSGALVAVPHGWQKLPHQEFDPDKTQLLSNLAEIFSGYQILKPSGPNQDDPLTSITPFSSSVFPQLDIFNEGANLLNQSLEPTLTSVDKSGKKLRVEDLHATQLASVVYGLRAAVQTPKNGDMNSDIPAITALALLAGQHFPKTSFDKRELGEPYTGSGPEPPQAKVYRAAVNALHAIATAPEPPLSESILWEQYFEARQDPAMLRRFVALHDRDDLTTRLIEHWRSNINAHAAEQILSFFESGITAAELEDERTHIGDFKESMVAFNSNLSRLLAETTFAPNSLPWTVLPIGTAALRENIGLIQTNTANKGTQRVDPDRTRFLNYLMQVYSGAEMFVSALRATGDRYRVVVFSTGEGEHRTTFAVADNVMTENCIFVYSSDNTQRDESGRPLPWSDVFAHHKTGARALGAIGIVHLEGWQQDVMELLPKPTTTR